MENFDVTITHGDLLWAITALEHVAQERLALLQSAVIFGKWGNEHQPSLIRYLESDYLPTLNRLSQKLEDEFADSIDRKQYVTLAEKFATLKESATNAGLSWQKEGK